MKKTGIMRVRVEAGQHPPAGGTDWNALRAITDEDARQAALSDPDAQPLTPEQLAGMRRVGHRRTVGEESAAWVRGVRQRQGLTQEQFAETFRVPLGTLRDWEQGRCPPDATARAFLKVIDREPEAVRRALGP